MNFLDIQSWWEIPYIAHFCSLFRSPFKLPEFDIEDLEEALLADGTTGDVPLLTDLIVALLKGCDLVRLQGITTSNYQMFLRRILRKKCNEYKLENTFDEDIDFYSLPLRSKILNLHLLCDIRLDSADVGPIYNCLEPDSLRIDPLGRDSNNSTYWYFHGTRLYREDTVKSANGTGNTSIWQVICFTEDDWNRFTNTLNNRRENERALRQILETDFLPKLPLLFQKKERNRRQKLIRLRTEALARLAEAEREKKYQEQLEHKRHFEETKKRRQERRKKVSAELDSFSVKDNRESRADRARRRSRSSSIQSIISTHASSSPTAHSSDLLFQSNEDVHNVKRLLQKFISNKNHDKENINNITLSTDSSDTDDESIPNTMPPTNNTNAKLPGRQTNNSLSSLTGNIFIPPFESGGRTESATSGGSDGNAGDASSRTSDTNPSSRNETPPAQAPRKKKAKTSDVSSFTSTLIPTLSFTETEEVLQIGMHKVLEYVKNHKDAWPFMDPVEEDIAPRYYSIIRRPMDLLKMEEKLDNGEYQTFNDFRNDFKLIVNNCRLYNGQNNEYTEMVNNLQLAFEKSTKKYFEQNSSDEEINLEYPDLKTNVFREKNFNAKNMTPKQVLLNEVSKKLKDTLNATSGKKVAGDKADKNRTTTKSSKANRDESRDKDTVNSTRGVKRKKKDKDKRRKKKPKLGKSSKYENSSDDESGKSDESDDEDEPPAKVAKKSAKVTAVTPEKKSKLLGSKHKKAGLKSKQKNSKKVEASSNDESDDERMEVVSKVKPSKAEEASKVKPSKAEEVSKVKPSKTEEVSKVKPPKTEEKKAAKGVAVKNKKLNKTEPTKLKAEEKKKKSSSHASVAVHKKESKHKKVDSSHSESEDEVEETTKAVPLTKTKKTKVDKPVPPKKSTKVDKKPKVPLSDNDSENENDFNSDMGSDGGVIDYPIKKKSKSSSAKVNKEETPPAKLSKKDKQTLKEKKKMEKENQNFKSKRKTEKASKKESKKVAKAKSAAKAKPDETVIEDDHRYRSSSRSVTPVFTVDLHKKYSKSASIPDTPGKSNSITRDKDLISMSSRSFSRSVSPAASHYSSNHSVNSVEDESISPSKLKTNKRLDRPITPDIKDKFDLIKERRSRNVDEKWNQIVKEAEKIKDKTASNQTSNTTLEKNQKLKETIEKLKAKSKNKSSKERAVLLNEIFGAKPPKEVRDERSIFERLRDTNADKPIKSKADKNSKNKADEYNFVEDTLSDTKPPKEPAQTKAKSQKKSTNKVAASKNLKSTNVEALDMETEQTLKDINRWLEHTPRFPDFGSASNSPSRYNLLDDFEAEFRRPDQSKNSSQSTVAPPSSTPSSSNGIPNAPAAVASNSNNDFNLLKETPNVFITPTAPTPPQPTQASPTVPPSTPRQTIQLQGLPPAPGSHKRDPKEPKRKTLKEKLTSMPKRKDLHRTIERLQPGKTKGNLISSNVKSDDQSNPVGTGAAKPKEVKNSLLQPTTESGPKLSLGSVLDETGFGLGQQHNFSDENAANSVSAIDETSKDRESDDMEIEEIITSTEMQKELAKAEKQKFDALEKESPILPTKPLSTEKPSATPNLSAWFKAFGAPKKTKKSEEDDQTSAASMVNANENIELSGDGKSLMEQANLQPCSPSEHPPGFMLPTPRTRRASTNSTVSERSSFSQDPDSPRVGIDERIGGAYGATYPSPLGASPIMASPKDELPKPSSPYPMNGAIKVGFYQDTTTKSSPEKSCSPREPPSPYNYAQNLYSSASASVAAAYGGACSYNNPTEPTQTATLGFNNKNKTPSYYDQYKQPRSQDSDYNSSMSPNPNSPYQNQQQSPYQQPEASPYHQPQSSPYQQPHSPYHQQQQQQQTAKAPGQQQQQQATPSESSPHSQFPPPNSPYQQQTSPYQQPNSPIAMSHHLQPQQQTAAAPNLFVQSTGFSQTQQASSIPKPPSTAQHQHPSTNYHSNPSSPYSQHDPNSPYAQGPMSPYNTLPNSPKSQPQQQQQQQQQQPKPNHPQHDWNNTMGQQQQQQQHHHQMDPPKISNPMPDQLSHSYPPMPAHMTSTNKHPSGVHGYHIPTYANPYAPPSIMDQLRPEDPNVPKQAVFNSAHQSSAHSPNNESGGNIPTGANMTGMDSMNDNRHMNVLKPNESSASPSNRHNHMHQSPRDLVNLGFPEQNLPQSKKSADKPLNTVVSDARSLETPKPTLNADLKGASEAVKHQQQVFDHLLGFSKNLGFGKGMDISTSKALEMFNRAATMGFPKGFPTSAGPKNDDLTKISSSSAADGNFARPSTLHSASPSLASSQSQKALFDMINMGYQQPLVGHDKAMPHDMGISKPLNMVNNAYNPQQMLAKGEYANTTPSDHSQQSKQQHPASMNYATNLSSQHPKSAASELNVPNPRVSEPNQQQKPCELNVPNLQRYDLNRQPPHSNIDLSNYKSSPYGSPGLDPNSLRMMDESLLGLQGTPSYYQKDIPPAHMYSKNIPQTSANLQQMLNNSMTMAYNTARDQQIQQNYQRHATLASNLPGTASAPVVNPSAPQHYMNPIPNQPLSAIDPKVSKRTKKSKKAATPTPTDTIQNQMLQHTQQQQHQQHLQQPQQQLHQQQQSQGFQSYAGLKANPSTMKSSPTTDPSLALKTAAANMVPGSAFNFGPTPTGLGLYGEQTGYLDEFRGTGNPYYLPGPPHPSAHRSTGETPADKLVQPPTPSSTYHQFLSHPSSRTTYPFMNAQLDPNSQIYQQYFQRQEEFRTARLMLNQGLLSHGAPAAYPQSGYLGMHKSSFDAMNQMNRPSSWFP
ncbi:uncharacterized protein LOC119083644 isoform X3 [Bradysia coprophila]|uniref:uncharacterized protein LOC119083644 isoform X3 n=1 Tax=Bradysia coprophila TaxID=38358 RepID=UPI00187D772D|nr:uncharacterized protein LOC119083644 isoform X3 [Bradysia coprophila]